MIDDTPEDLDFSQMPSRVRAATSLLGSFGWKLMLFELSAKLATVEAAMLDTEALTKQERARLWAERRTIKDIMAIPTALANYKKPVTETL